MIPEPPVEDTGWLRVFSYDIVAALEPGVVGGCCLCGESSVYWWVLDACGMAPVTDSHGQLADEVPLHPRCVLGVLAHWAMILHGDDESDDGSPPALAGPVAAAPQTRRAPSGVYAR